MPRPTVGSSGEFIRPATPEVFFGNFLEAELRNFSHDAGGREPVLRADRVRTSWIQAMSRGARPGDIDPRQ